MNLIRVVRDVWFVFQDSRRSSKYLKVWWPLFSLAFSDQSIAVAASQLRPVVESDRLAARYARTAVAREHEDANTYVTDRALRILHEAMGSPAPPPPTAARAELFARERSLGAQPLREAFAQLAAEIPALRELERTAHSNPLQDPDSAAVSEIMRGISSLVGPGTPSPDPLHRSRLARTIASDYLLAIGDSAGPAQLQEFVVDRPASSAWPNRGAWPDSDVLRAAGVPV